MSANAKARIKLLIAVSVLLGCLIFIGILAMLTLNRLDRSIAIFASTGIQKSTLADDVDTQAACAYALTYKYIVAQDDSIRSETKAALEDCEKAVVQAIEQYQQFCRNADEVKLVNEAWKKWNTYQAYEAEVITYCDEGQEDAAAALMLNDLQAAYDEASSSFKGMMEMRQSEGLNMIESSDLLLQRLLLAIAVYMGALVVVGVLLAVLLICLLTRTAAETKLVTGR